MPPLEQGMSIVDAFEPTGAAPAPGPAPAAAPAAAFLSTGKVSPNEATESMSVEVLSAVFAPGGKDMQLKHSTIALPLDDGCD